MKLTVIHIKVGILLSLAITAGMFWYVATLESSPGILTVAFLNIGQGDALYIKSPTGTELLVDGGPGRALLSELSKLMPFYDRTIDGIMITNPDKDHFAGFIDVLPRYKVKQLFESGTPTDTDTYKTFSALADKEQMQEIIVRRGMVLDLGGGAKLTILYPDTDVSSKETNEGSIIARLSYGDVSVMLTGDAPNSIEEKVVALDQTPNDTEIKSTVLKFGHHGSRTSASESFIAAVNPTYAIISAGKNNRYGHPHKESLELLNRLNIPALITAEKGTIILRSDGSTFNVEYN